MNNYLEHYGVVGMRWGRRRASSQPRLTGPTSSDSGSNNSSSGYNSSSFGGKKKKVINAKYRVLDDDDNTSSSSSKSSGSSSKSSGSSSKGSGSSSDKSSNTKTNKPKQEHANGSPNNKPKSNNKQTFETKELKTGLNEGKKLADAKAKKMKEQRESEHENKLREQTKTMSNAEMQEVITRLSMEQRYVDVMKKNSEPEAKSKLETTLDIVGQAAAYADTAISVYNTIEDIRRKLN